MEFARDGAVSTRGATGAAVRMYMPATVHMYMHATVHMYMPASVHMYMPATVCIYVPATVHMYVPATVHMYMPTREAGCSEEEGNEASTQSCSWKVGEWGSEASTPQVESGGCQARCRNQAYKGHPAGVFMASYTFLANSPPGE